MDTGTGAIIRFGGCRLDGAARRLMLEASGDMIPLGSRAFNVLLHLATRPGVLAPKADLMHAGWPDVTVEENSLSQCISSIRKALGPAASHIVTETGRGYRFVVDMAPDPLLQRGAWRTTDNPEAYRLFVSAWTAMSAPGVDNIKLSISRLEKAIELDPGYALAHAQHAKSITCLGTFGFARPGDVLPRARAAVMRALEIDSELPEAHAEMGHQQFGLELDLKGALRSLQRALELDRNSMDVLASLASLMGMLGRFEDADVYFGRLHIAEPLYPALPMGAGAARYFQGRYEEAIVLLESALELHPGFALAHHFLGRCCLMLGDYDRAIAEFKACKYPVNGVAASLPCAWALCGRTEEARTALAQLKAPGEAYVSPYDIATVHLALGEREEALTWLERSVDDPAQGACFMKIDPMLTGLRGEPRFRALLKRIGAD